MPITPISVALVEDDPCMRERVGRVIATEKSMVLVKSAATAAELLTWLAQHTADVVLVDLGLPDRSGLEVISECVRLCPACAVMVLTLFGDEANMLAAFEAGARGYLLKDGTEDDLSAHVLALHAGGSPMSPLIARQLLVRWKTAQPAEVSVAVAVAPSSRHVGEPERLSPRETQALNLISRGFTYAEIADQMNVSLTTVQTHVRNVYGKMGVHSKTEAVFEARQAGWLT
jgi:DNA-binding NarL/FixJ family response regulator